MSNSSPSASPPAAADQLSQYQRICGVLKKCGLYEKLMGLVQTNDLVDALFEISVDFGIGQLEKACREAQIDLSANLWIALKGTVQNVFKPLLALNSNPIPLSTSVPSSSSSSSYSSGSVCHVPVAPPPSLIGSPRPSSPSSFSGSTYNCTSGTIEKCTIHNNTTINSGAGKSDSKEGSEVAAEHRALEPGKKTGQENSWVLTQKAKLILDQLFKKGMLSEKKSLKGQTGEADALSHAYRLVQGEFKVNATGKLESGKVECTKWSTKELQGAVKTYLGTRISNRMQKVKRDLTHCHSPSECWKGRPNKRVRIHPHIPIQLLPLDLNAYGLQISIH
jgi:hypothetical protein